MLLGLEEVEQVAANDGAAVDATDPGDERALMPPLRPRHIPALLLRRASESRPPATGSEDYDVIGKDGKSWDGF